MRRLQIMKHSTLLMNQENNEPLQSDINEDTEAYSNPTTPDTETSNNETQHNKLPEIPVLDDSGYSYGAVTEYVEASNQFAFSMYKQYQSSEENLFYSPYSISTAFNMVYEGARGSTADEIQTVFYIQRDETARRYAAANIYNTLNENNTLFKLYTANALWVQTGFAILQEFTDIIHTYYGGEVTNVDFAFDQARITINNWVSKWTNNNIPELFPPGSLEPGAPIALVLTNTVYFKGDWMSPFVEEWTESEDFHISPYKTIKTPMMNVGNKYFGYSSTNTHQVLELPYHGEEISMYIFLPKNKYIHAFENQFSYTKYLDSLELEHTKIKSIKIPKFKIEAKYFMNEDLAEMGMPTAFSGNADFSGIYGASGDIWIDKVIHQAYIDVNEQGTEAAGATGISMTLGMDSGSVEFHADHPFIFVIQDKKTGLILFIGRVMDPGGN